MQNFLYKNKDNNNNIRCLQSVGRNKKTKQNKTNKTDRQWQTHCVNCKNCGKILLLTQWECKINAQFY